MAAYHRVGNPDALCYLETVEIRGIDCSGVWHGKNLLDLQFYTQHRDGLIRSTDFVVKLKHGLTSLPCCWETNNFDLLKVLSIELGPAIILMVYRFGQTTLVYLYSRHVCMWDKCCP